MANDTNIRRVLTTLGWLLILSAASLLLVGPFLHSDLLDPLKNILPAGILVALATNLFAQAKTASDRAEKDSIFHLEHSIQAYEQAISIIEDGNNDRRKWIEAARCLGHAKILAAKVTLDAHQRVLELNRLKYRTIFHGLLESKTGAFFYGTSDPNLSIDEAAKKASAPMIQNGRHYASTANDLTEESIKAIWESAQWPDNYNDPLGEKFTENECSKLFIVFPGISKYIEHRRKWRSIGEKLVPRQPVNNNN